MKSKNMNSTWKSDRKPQRALGHRFLCLQVEKTEETESKKFCFNPQATFWTPQAQVNSQNSTHSTAQAGPSLVHFQPLQSFCLPTLLPIFPSWQHFKTNGKYLNATLNNYKVRSPSQRGNISKSRRGASARQLNRETLGGARVETSSSSRFRAQC